MKIKCPNCSAGMKYVPGTKDLFCSYCGSSFLIDSIPKECFEEDEPGESEEAAAEELDDGVLDDSNEETMECKIYSCRSCGAELMINDVESSTFCAYCGEPTIVFSRVSRRLRPKYIIPFTVKKEEALKIIRHKLEQGSYVPSEIKNFEVDTLRGIYVPFWMFDVYMHDKQLIKGKKSQGKSTVTRYYYREGKIDFTDIPVDASITLNDISSQRLEPFDCKKVVDFDPAYLSGFYADCQDESKDKMMSTAMLRAQKLFDQEMLQTVRASSLSIINRKPEIVVKNSEYALFPVWFLVFKHDLQYYTMMVNGQTGKVVGAVPCDEDKVRAHIVIVGTILAIVFAAIFGTVMSTGVDEDSLQGLIYLLIIVGLFVKSGFSSRKAYLKSQELTKASQIKKFAKDRQKGG